MSAPATTAVGGERRVRWLDSIPPDWTVVPSKWLFSHTKERARYEDEQLTASQDDGVIPQAEFMRRAGRQVMQVLLNREILKHVERDDFVISMRSFQGGLERSWAQGCISSAYVVLRPGPEVHVPFFAHLFKSTAYIQALQATSNLVRDGQALRFDNFCMVHLPRVPLPTQRAIAAFLDRKTAAIDALIEKKQKLLDLLAEKRAALINQAVTKGLDPSVPMKDSGVPWIGEIPAHWEVMPLRLRARVVDCKHRTPTYVEHGFPLVSTTEVKPGRLDLSVVTRLVDDDDFDEMTENRRPRRGDLIYSRNASLGAAAYVDTDEPFAMGQDVVLITAESDLLYLSQFLNSQVGMTQVELACIGSTFKRLNVSHIKQIQVCVPPPDEAKRIAAHVDEHDRHQTVLRQRLTGHVDRLQEYRQALITAAVTGQLDTPPLDTP